MNDRQFAELKDAVAMMASHMRGERVRGVREIEVPEPDVKAIREAANVSQSDFARLIGMHIAIKTLNFRDWLWTTFDHVAIAPTWDEVAATLAGAGNPYAPFGEARSTNDEKTDWMFFAPQRGECLGDCAEASLLNKGTKVIGATLSTLPSRIIRMQPRGYYFAADANPRDCDVVRKSDGDATNFFDPDNLVEIKSYHDMDCLVSEGLKNSVMVYYQLKGAQWFKPETEKIKVPEPDVLANAALEAFSQADSSCLSCHTQARPSKSTSALPIYDFIFAAGRPGIAVTAVPKTSTNSGNGN